MFIKLNEFVFKCPSVLTYMEFKVLLQLAFLMNWSSNLILLDDDLRLQISSRLDISLEYLSKIIRSLKKKGFLMQKGFYYEILKDFASKGR